MVEIRQHQAPTPQQQKKNRVAEGGGQSAQEQFRRVSDEPAENFE
jgi:hypothetical protein